jgi:hypothetical protein
VGTKRHGNGSVQPPDGSRYEGRHQEVAATAPIGLGDPYPCVALLGQLLPEPARKIIALLYGCIVRPDLALRKLEGTFIGELVFLRQFKIHKGMPPGTPGFLQGRKAAPSSLSA